MSSAEMAQKEVIIKGDIRLHLCIVQPLKKRQIRLFNLANHFTVRLQICMNILERNMLFLGTF